MDTFVLLAYTQNMRGDVVFNIFDECQAEDLMSAMVEFKQRGAYAPIVQDKRGFLRHEASMRVVSHTRH